MQCEQVHELLPVVIDGDERHLDVEFHIETCLRCQAEVARYRKLLRAMSMLRTRYLDPNPAGLAQALAGLESELERSVVRAALSGKRLAYAGAIGGTVATAATVAAFVARNRKRTLKLAG